MDGAKRKGKHGKHGKKRGAKRARGKPVTLRGKLFGIGKRGRRVTFRADRALDVADFMDGARGRAKAKQARAAKRPKKKNGRRRKKRSAAQKAATLRMLAALKAKRGGRHTGRRTGGHAGGRKKQRTEAQLAATRRMVSAACVHKVMRESHGRGTDLTYTQAHHMCREMREASVKAAAATASIPTPMAPSETEKYAAACRREFKAVLGNQVEKLEAKYCRAGWTRHQVRETLETISKQMAAT